MKKLVSTKVSTPRPKPEPKVSVSELNVRKAAARLLTTKLVSTEIAYVQRTLGSSATQAQLDERVLAVRRLPWSAIAMPE
jgi:hypothetical protein